MKLATYRSGAGEPAIGCVDVANGTIFDLQASHQALHGGNHPALVDMLSLMQGGSQALDLVRHLEERLRGDTAYLFKLDNVQLLSPVPVPPQIRDFNNFEQHMRGASFGMARLKARLAGQPDPDQSKIVIPDVNFRQPIFYLSNRFNVVGQDADVRWPSYCNWFDYEAEFGIFIGRAGRDIPKEQAKDHIFGYSIFNDFSARDRQAREMEGWMGPTKGKSFDTGNAIGPWIVTRDEVMNPYSLAVAVRINGEIVGKSRTAGMIHTFEDIIAFLSCDETIHVGEFLGSGTIGGCCGLESDRWLEDGDRVELEFENIGVLRNRVVRRPSETEN
jgi:2-keto-4-pentenoate hydratase/2-oxohepta-3-ene-1,7-dioic acid hydratase in catechol pathway